MNSIISCPLYVSRSAKNRYGADVISVSWHYPTWKYGSASIYLNRHNKTYALLKRNIKPLSFDKSIFINGIASHRTMAHCCVNNTTLTGGRIPTG